MNSKREERAMMRALSCFDRLPLKKGETHFLKKRLRSRDKKLQKKPLRKKKQLEPGKSSRKSKRRKDSRRRPRP